MKVICISNMKGGTGRSTTSVALANGLHDQGKRVLLTDMDPQMNAAFMSGVNIMGTQSTLFDVFRGEADMDEAISHLRFGFDLAMCGLQGTAADVTFTGLGRERILLEALETVRDDYDYVICDTSPSLSLLTTAALTAADYMIIPLTADPLAVQGAVQLDAYTKNVRRYCNPNLRVLGVVITMYNGRSTLTKSMEDAIQAAAAQMKTTVFDTRIRRAQALQDATATQQDPFTAAARSTATQDYRLFVSEVMERMEGNGKK